jgi:dUTP pyrophosphatase
MNNSWTQNNLPSLPIKVKKLRDDAILPSYAKPGDSGADLYAVEDTAWEPVFNTAKECIGYKAIVKTGLAVELPDAYEWQIRPRSGNAGKFNITVLNTPGTVDCGYRGEIMVILFCFGALLGDYADGIKRGAKIAQAVLAPVSSGAFVVVDDVSATERGTGALNSTGTY